MQANHAEQGKRKAMWRMARGIVAAAFLVVSMGADALGQERRLDFSMPVARRPISRPTMRLGKQAKSAVPFAVAQASAAGATFESGADHCYVWDVDVGGAVYSGLRLSSGGLGGDVGRPQLPYYGKFIQIPRGVRANLVIDTVTWTDLPDTVSVIPRQPAPIDGAGVAPADRVRFAMDADAYAADVFMPKVPVQCTGRMRIRGRDFVYVTFHPLAYNPARSTLKAATNVRWRLDYMGTPEPTPADALGQAAFAPAFDYALDARGPEVLEKGGGFPIFTGAGADYLIITHDDLVDEVMPLAEWKHVKGYKTRVVPLSEIGPAPTANDITAYIAEAYATWNPRPLFLLLVGDVNYLPTHYDGTEASTGAPLATDLPYATVDGPDIFPDLFYGRFPCGSEAECTTMVSKTLIMERMPDPTPSYYQTAMTAGYFQDVSSPDPADGYEGRIFVETCEAVREYFQATGLTNVLTSYVTQTSIFPQHYSQNAYGSLMHPSGSPYGSSPLYLSAGASSTAISTAVNDGIWLLQHRDHGYTQGWGDPPYNNGHVNALTNGTKFPIVMSINCQTGYFDGASDCFTEAWLQKQDGGSHAVMSATRISYSWWNDWFVHGMYMCMFPDYLSTLASIPYYRNDLSYAGNPIGHGVHLGQVANYGKMVMFDKLAGGSTGGANWYQYKILQLFGDPEIQPRWAVPTALVVDHPASLGLGGGPSAFEVTVRNPLGAPVEGALVALVMGSTDHHTALTNGIGVALFNFTPGSAGVMHVTATEQNSLPYEGTLMVQDPTPYGIHLTSPNGGEHVPLGDTLPISWAATGMLWSPGDTVTLDVSFNGGGSWYDIPGAGSLPHDMPSFLWDTSSAPPSSMCRVRVLAHPDPSFTDMSDGDFELYEVLRIVNDSKLSPATVGQFYVESLMAMGGSPPYTWSGPGGDYAETLGSGGWQGGGTAMGWHGDDQSFPYTLPWPFEFYGNTYTSVNVCTNGFLDFASSSSDFSNSVGGLIDNVRIAPFWDDLRTDGPGEDIFVTEAPGSVTFRWQAETYSSGVPAEFEAVLHQDGSIQFSYDIDHTSFSPTIGISAGNGADYLISSLDPGPVPAGTTATFAQQGLLPPGLNLDPMSGDIYGVPTQAGAFSFEVTVEDAVMGTATKMMDVAVTPPPPVMGPLPDPSCEGRLPVTWSDFPGANAHQAQYSLAGNFFDAVSSPVVPSPMHTFTGLPTGPVVVRARSGVYTGPDPLFWQQTTEEDFAVDVLESTQVVPTGDGAVALAGGADRREEVLGGDVAPTSVSGVYGNVFYTNETRHLVEVTQYLDLPVGETAYALVYHTDSDGNPIAPVAESLPVAGAGPGWYGGPIDAMLEAGNYYLVGVFLTNGTVWDDDMSVHNDPSWGYFEGGIWNAPGLMPWEFYQTLVTEGTTSGSGYEDELGESNWASSVFGVHGNVIQATESVHLTSLSQHLVVDPGESVSAVVIETDPAGNLLGPVFTSPPIPGIGDDWYDFSIDAALTSGHYYLVGVDVTSGVVFDDDGDIGNDPSWGTFEGSYWDGTGGPAAVASSSLKTSSSGRASSGTDVLGPWEFHQILRTGGGGGAGCEEVLGSDDYDESVEVGVYGNMFQAVEATHLVDVKQYLTLPPGEEAVALVFETDSAGNPIALVDDSPPIPGAGEGWYGAPVDAMLEAGSYYLIGVYLTGGSTWDDDGNVQNNPSWGTFLGSFWNEPVLAPYEFYQTLTIECDAAPGGTVTTLAVDVPADLVGATLTYSTDTPPGTAVTVDVLDAADDSVLLAGVTSGTDLVAMGVLAPAIKLRGTLTTATPGVSPLLLDWSLYWEYPEGFYAWSDWSMPAFTTVIGLPDVTAFTPPVAIPLDPIIIEGTDLPQVITAVFLSGPGPMIPLQGMPSVNPGGTMLTGLNIPAGTPVGTYGLVFADPRCGLVAATGATLEVVKGLQVASFPIPGVPIGGTHPGATPYRIVDTGIATLTAPWQVGGHYFMEWQNGAGATLAYSATITVAIDSHDILVALYDDSVTDFYVDDDTGNDDNAGTSPAAAAATVQVLLSRYTGWVGKTINMGPGVYVGPIVLGPEAEGVTLRGAGDGDDPMADTLVLSVIDPCLVIAAGGAGPGMPLTVEDIRFLGEGAPPVAGPATLSLEEQGVDLLPGVAVVAIEVPPGTMLADVLLRDISVVSENMVVGLLVRAAGPGNLLERLVVDGCRFSGPSMAAMVVDSVNLDDMELAGTNRWTFVDGGAVTGLFLGGANGGILSNIRIHDTAFFGGGQFDILLDDTQVTVDALTRVLFCTAPTLADIEERVWHLMDDPSLGEVLFGVPAEIGGNMICFDSKTQLSRLGMQMLPASSTGWYGLEMPAGAEVLIETRTRSGIVTTTVLALDWTGGSHEDAIPMGVSNTLTYRVRMVRGSLGTLAQISDIGGLCMIVNYDARRDRTTCGRTSWSGLVLHGHMIFGPGAIAFEAEP